jgi:hypothetical protein
MMEQVRPQRKRSTPIPRLLSKHRNTPRFEIPFWFIYALLGVVSMAFIAWRSFLTNVFPFILHDGNLLLAHAEETSIAHIVCCTARMIAHVHMPTNHRKMSSHWPQDDLSNFDLFIEEDVMNFNPQLFRSQWHELGKLEMVLLNLHEPINSTAIRHDTPESGSWLYNASQI